MNIIMLASEAVPFVKTGGLADVVGSLPGELCRRGHRVIVVLPKYSQISTDRFSLKPVLGPMGVWMGDTQEWCLVHAADNEGVPVYFIESNKYFDRWGLYHDASYNDYQDNPRRFGFLTQAGLQLCRDLQFKPDIVNVHDWMTALAPAYLKIWYWDDPLLGEAASVLTIHNVAYQGVYSARDYPYLGLQWGNFTSDKFEDYGQMNLLKGGIFYADMINTVSPTYALETRTPEGSFGLAPYLNNRGQDYIGILNGVDYRRWDPAVDTLIPARFTPDDLSGKLVCKRELQKRFLLDVNPNIPVIGVISRLVNQKGLDLLAQVIEPIVTNMLVQFVILGSGDKNLEQYYGYLPARYPGRIGSYIGYNDELSHWIEAGSDFFIMPSYSEPCGLNQIYSLKYGTLPIVRATGGLDDTVQQYDEDRGAGTGFKFQDAAGAAIYDTIGWAVSTYFDRYEHIETMRLLAMAQDFSWERSAQEYERMYARAIANKRLQGVGG